LIEVGSKTADKNSAQTNRQTDKPRDTTKIMVTWPWTNCRLLPYDAMEYGENTYKVNLPSWLQFFWQQIRRSSLNIHT